MKTIKLFLPIFLLVLFIMGESTYAQESTNQVEVGYRKSGRIDAKGFQLNKETTIQIKGTAGLYDRMGNDLIFYGWILDGKTRKVVWNLLKALVILLKKPMAMTIYTKK